MHFCLQFSVCHTYTSWGTHPRLRWKREWKSQAAVHRWTLRWEELGYCWFEICQLNMKFRVKIIKFHWSESIETVLMILLLCDDKCNLYCECYKNYFGCMSTCILTCTYSFCPIVVRGLKNQRVINIDNSIEFALGYI